MAADVGFVARAAERNADVRPAHRPRDGFRDRRLADSRRSDKQQRRRPRRAIVFIPRRFRLRLALAQLTDRQKLEHLIFDVLKTVVILFQYLRRPFQIERLVGAPVPG